MEGHWQGELTLKPKVPGCQKSALGLSWVAWERSSVRPSGPPQCLQVPHGGLDATYMYKGLEAQVVHAVSQICDLPVLHPCSSAG